MNDKLIINHQPGLIKLAGTLGFSTVATADNQWLNALNEHCDTIEVDLAEVGRIDSAGLALMVSWMKLAQEKGVAIRYTHLPRSLAGMAAIYGIDSLFQVVDRDKSGENG
ncbi:MAG TPA: STAS domain-containing protein [Halothiobacillaceae bacterium]|nr:STAS domain-containing protein [Halothiobacillaceae bacterium]